MVAIGYYDDEEEEKIDDVKEGVENTDDTYARKNLKYYRHRVGAAVNDRRTQFLIVVLITVNSILMGVQTSNAVRSDPELDAIFDNVDLFFLIVFTIELCLQFFYIGYYIFLDGWLLFDFLVVLCSWLSEIVGGNNLQVLRAFRIFRALRLITRVKVMRDIVESLLSSLPRMSAIGFLLSICFYIFGVMFTNLYSEVDSKYLDEDSPDYLESAPFFLRLDLSLFTLFQLLTMDGWIDVTREFMIIDSYAYIPFLVYVTVAGFIFFNLIIAVLCDAIAEQSGAEERAEREKDSSELQTQIEELKISQEKTLHTIEYLIRQLKLSTEM